MTTLIALVFLVAMAGFVLAWTAGDEVRSLRKENADLAQQVNHLHRLGVTHAAAQRLGTEYVPAPPRSDDNAWRSQ